MQLLCQKLSTIGDITNENSIFGSWWDTFILGGKSIDKSHWQSSSHLAVLIQRPSGGPNC